MLSSPKNKKILFIIIIFFILCGCSRVASKQTEENNKTTNRIKYYNILFQNEYGGPIENKDISIKKIQNNILFNFPEIDSNINIIKIKNENPETLKAEKITTEKIINELKLNTKEINSNNKKYNILIIPLIYPRDDTNKISLGDFAKDQIDILESYGKAIEQNNIKIGFVEILDEFNEKMTNDFNFDKEESFDFIEIYTKKTKNIFKNAQIIIDINEMLCYREYALQAEDNRCLSNPNSIDQWEFIKTLNNRKIPYDIIGFKYYPSLKHSSLFMDFEKMFDDLILVGKKIYIKEFFIPEEEPSEALLKNKPDTGWSNEYQSNFFKKTLNYINYYPEIIGINYVENNLNNKSIKSNTENWIKNMELNAKLKTNENGFALLPLAPGTYEFKLNWRTKKTIELENDLNLIVKFK